MRRFKKYLLKETTLPRIFLQRFVCFKTEIMQRPSGLISSILANKIIQHHYSNALQEILPLKAFDRVHPPEQRMCTSLLQKHPMEIKKTLFQ